LFVVAETETKLIRLDWTEGEGEGEIEREGEKKNEEEDK